MNAINKLSSNLDQSSFQNKKQDKREQSKDHSHSLNQKDELSITDVAKNKFSIKGHGPEFSSCIALLEKAKERNIQMHEALENIRDKESVKSVNQRYWQFVEEMKFLDGLVNLEEELCPKKAVYEKYFETPTFIEKIKTNIKTSRLIDQNVLDKAVEEINFQYNEIENERNKLTVEIEDMFQVKTKEDHQAEAVSKNIVDQSLTSLSCQLSALSKNFLKLIKE